MASQGVNQYIVRHQFLARAIVVGVIGVFLIIFGLIPLVSGISQKSQKIVIRSKDEKILLDKVSLLTQLDQNVLADRLEILDLALPPRKDVVAYLAAIDGLARELGLSFGGLSLSPGDVTDQSEAGTKVVSKNNAGGLQSLDTTIRMKGNKDGVYTFLKNVEQTLPLMQIKDVKVSVLADEQYSLSLSMGMLWAPPTVSDVKGAVALFNDQEEAYFQTLFGYHSYKSELDASTVQSFEDTGRVDLFSK